MYSLWYSSLPSDLVTSQCFSIYDKSRVLSRGVFGCPLAANALRVLLVLLVMLCDVGGERIVRVWRAEQGLYGKQDRADLQGRRPLVCEG